MPLLCDLHDRFDQRKLDCCPTRHTVRTYFENLFRTLGATPPAQTCEVLSFFDAEKVILHSNSIGMLSYSNGHLADLPNDLKKVDVDLPHGRVPIGLTVREIGDVGAILSRFEQILRSLLKDDGYVNL